MAEQSWESIDARLDRLEKILGLQKLDTGPGEDLQPAERGQSTQSNHCGGSALSVVCAEAMPR